MNKENLVEISDYFRELRDNHKIKVHICPRQTGVTYNLVHNERFIAVEKQQTIDYIKYNCPNESKDSVFITSNSMEHHLTSDGLIEYYEHKDVIVMDNCLLFFDEDGNRIKLHDIPQKIFYPFNPLPMYNNLYVHKNTLEVFKMFDGLEFWYTCEL